MFKNIIRWLKSTKIDFSIRGFRTYNVQDWKAVRLLFAFATLMLIISLGVFVYDVLNFNKLNKKEIVDQYGLEVINYFYETAFHDDKAGRMDKTVMWKNDIQVSLHGNLLENDSLYVEDALSILNALETPISLKFADDPNKSNLKIFFGDLKFLEDSLMTKLDPYILGFFITTHNTRFRTSGMIGIRNNAEFIDTQHENDYPQLRKNVILEEMAQVLGTHGDSFTFYNSLFFEGNKDIDGLSSIDKKIVEFLYDKNVFRRYGIYREDFEKIFSDELYSNLSFNKFYNLANQYGLDKQDINSLKSIMFTSISDGTFHKFPRKAFLRISGDSTKEHFETCKILVNQLNDITPYFKLELVESESLWKNTPLIIINYEEGEKYEGTVRHRIEYVTEKMMFTYKTKGTIHIKYSKVDNDRESKLRHALALYERLFEILGLRVPMELLVSKTSTPNNLVINDKYKKYFKFVYDPRFPTDIIDSDYEGLLKEYNY